MVTCQECQRNCYTTLIWRIKDRPGGSLIILAMIKPNPFATDADYAQDGIQAVLSAVDLFAETQQFGAVKALICPPHNYIINFDGSSTTLTVGRDGGIAVVLATPTNPFALEFSLRVCQQTCNRAEFLALLAGLRLASLLGLTNVIFRGDNEIAIDSMNGLSKIKHPGLVDIYAYCKKIAASIPNKKFEHVCRENNLRADMLAGATWGRR